ncbi:MAG: hypothetical protein C4523_09485 [Myxococcales bacterium]|nr:MAG: hypothetical protein C4523_09485 [Myxococcales bacterium]
MTISDSTFNDIPYDSFTIIGKNEEWAKLAENANRLHHIGTNLTVPGGAASGDGHNHKGYDPATFKGGPGIPLISSGLLGYNIMPLISAADNSDAPFITVAPTCFRDDAGAWGERFVDTTDVISAQILDVAEDGHFLILDADYTTDLDAHDYRFFEVTNPSSAGHEHQAFALHRFRCLQEFALIDRTALFTPHEASNDFTGKDIKIYAYKSAFDPYAGEWFGLWTPEWARRLVVRFRCTAAFFNTVDWNDNYVFELISEYPLWNVFLRCGAADGSVTGVMGRASPLDGHPEWISVSYDLDALTKGQVNQFSLRAEMNEDLLRIYSPSATLRQRVELYFYRFSNNRPSPVFYEFQANDAG